MYVITNFFEIIIVYALLTMDFIKSYISKIRRPDQKFGRSENQLEQDNFVYLSLNWFCLQNLMPLGIHTEAGH